MVSPKIFPWPVIKISNSKSNNLLSPNDGVSESGGNCCPLGRWMLVPESIIEDALPWYPTGMWSQFGSNALLGSQTYSLHYKHVDDWVKVGIVATLTGINISTSLIFDRTLFMLSSIALLESNISAIRSLTCRQIGLPNFKKSFKASLLKIS